jgi:hypothetical protein
MPEVCQLIISNLEHIHTYIVQTGGLLGADGGIEGAMTHGKGSSQHADARADARLQRGCFLQRWAVPEGGFDL